jgi:adenylate cyclase
MGDNVNLGSRLEGINKEYKTNIIISEFTNEKVKDHNMVTRKIDLVAVKGKSKPVTIYELLGEGRVPQKVSEKVGSFNEGFELYLKQEWDKAIENFEKAKATGIDPTAGIFIERCRNYKENPPGDDWSGVYIMKTK